jgi:hypothetical protein
MVTQIMTVNAKPETPAQPIPIIRIAPALAVEANAAK